MEVLVAKDLIMEDIMKGMVERLVQDIIRGIHRIGQ